MSAPKPDAEPNFIMLPPDPATESVERLRRQALRLLTETRAGDNEHPAPPSPSAAGAARRDQGPASSSAPSMIAGVLAMPAVFLAIVFVALAVFGKPGDQTTNAAIADAALQSPPAQSRAAAPPLVSASSEERGVISLSDDARIQSIALDGDRVALHVEGPAGREILVYDYREGRQIAAAAIETVTTEATDTLGMLTGPPPAAPVAATEVSAAELAAARTTVTPRLKPRNRP